MSEPYRGKLDNGGERIELYKPDPPQTNGEVPYVLIEKMKTAPDYGGVVYLFFEHRFLR